MGVVLSAAMTAALAYAIVPVLLRRSIVDVPNARSSHVRVTPRGGGLAPVAVLLALAALAATSGLLPQDMAILAVLALALALLSLADDIRSIGAGLRLSVHLGAVMIALGMLVPTGTGLFKSWLPLPLEWTLLAVGLLWFMNLFNFMDGIDGISGTELASLGLGIMAVLWISGDATRLAGLMLAAGVLAGAGLGFLAVNWHPARVFMGDVGSVTLGFLAGWLLLLLAMGGHLAAALILPAYYITDATVTLLIRIVEGDRLSEAHRKHAYQRAVRGGLSHDGLCLRIAALNAALAALAMLASHVAGVVWPLTLMFVAYALALALFLQFRRMA